MRNKNTALPPPAITTPHTCNTAYLLLQSPHLTHATHAKNYRSRQNKHKYNEKYVMTLHQNNKSQYRNLISVYQYFSLCRQPGNRSILAILFITWCKLTHSLPSPSLSLPLSPSPPPTLLLPLKVFIFAHPNKQSDAIRRIIIWSNLDRILFSVMVPDIH